ncbi:MAG TPA: biotin carboxylase N-terminal domain-containing protein [Steroidobacteraceae bacterium]|nr:biotin carboxylase N-terminal domain-containing protein [Steroidobacteraceae bacterium]
MKTLNRLLIANRGEIAVRIARTARRLGITTIAVCSDADRDSPHVAACDEHIPIGGSSPAESYLDAGKLLAAAAAAQAHAVHPGYGFLSENARFAAAVTAADLIFVGPPAAAIDAMGDKARARQRMAAAGIPVVSGYDGEAQDEATLLAAAEHIGFPVMVKAAAGGGGRGMRLVAAPEELPAALQSAASEAAKAFGDGRLILERAVVEPRHVEIQVLADAHGNAIHLGERDCSVQRRHQKIVEEAPSPAVDPVLRERMGQAAVAVAREIGYLGAGTVEFLLDPNGQFYFMEMNTRLQVEHPVTELVTGLDLVELQLRIARGERLPLTQSEVAIRGHAIEVRLCAEEPADEFLPRSGTVLDWRAEELVRCDHAVAVGMTVSPWYDSLLAKVIAHGATRAEAIDRLARALDRTTLLGVPTNRSFLARVLRHPSFADGSASTAFIGRHFADAASRAQVPDARTWALAAWLSVAAAPEASATPSAWRHWSNGQPLPNPFRLRWAAPQSLAGSAAVDRSGRVRLAVGTAMVEGGEAAAQVSGMPVAAGATGHVEIDGTELWYRYAWDGAVLWVHANGGEFAFRCLRREPARSGADGATGGAEVRASINGRVLEVTVVPGAEVQVGARLVVLEAMKMEHEVRATRAGRIAAVNVRSGEQVAPGQWLVRFEGES